MKKMSKALLGAFILVSVGNLVANFFEWELGVFFTKPLLMTFLAAWFYMETGLSTAFHRLIFFGLLFSVAGDVFMMLAASDPKYFLLGLGNFLITHLFYIAAFLKFPEGKNGLVRRKPWLLLPVLAFLVFMNVYLWPDLPEAFLIPVFVYSMVISGMLITALNMVGRVEGSASKLLVYGALLFVLSDSLIAVHKFKATGIPALTFSLAIMSTYLLGQYLIAKACTYQVNEPKTGSSKLASLVSERKSARSL